MLLRGAKRCFDEAENAAGQVMPPVKGFDGWHHYLDREELMDLMYTCYRNDALMSYGFYG